MPPTHSHFIPVGSEIGSTAHTSPALVIVRVSLHLSLHPHHKKILPKLHTAVCFTRIFSFFFSGKNLRFVWKECESERNWEDCNETLFTAAQQVNFLLLWWLYFSLSLFLLCCLLLISSLSCVGTIFSMKTFGLCGVCCACVFKLLES